MRLIIIILLVAGIIYVETTYKMNIDNIAFWAINIPMWIATYFVWSKQ